jgi:hypothetical protein
MTFTVRTCLSCACMGIQIPRFHRICGVAPPGVRGLSTRLRRPSCDRSALARECTAVGTDNGAHVRHAHYALARQRRLFTNQFTPARRREATQGGSTRERCGTRPRCGAVRCIECNSSNLSIRLRFLYGSTVLSTGRRPIL